MKLYCCQDSCYKGKVEVVELEVTERPSTYKVEESPRGVYARVISKKGLGQVNGGDQCFGLTKNQAIDGFIEWKAEEIRRNEERLKKKKETLRQARELIGGL